MPRIMDDKVESVDEKGGEIEGVGDVLQTNVLRQSFDQCLTRSTKKQVVISSDFDHRKGVRLCVVVKVVKEIVDIAGMLLVMKVCLWIIGDCLTTSRNLDSKDEEGVSMMQNYGLRVRIYFSKSDNALSLMPRWYDAPKGLSVLFFCDTFSCRRVLNFCTMLASLHVRYMEGLA
jgi:hypothetical protein